jgi:hypothetical protein
LANALWPNLPSSNSALPVAPWSAPALPVAPVVTKRKGFFSFHYDDLMRVNNVRQSWKISHPDRELKRNFYDRSLWERTKLNNPEGLKNLIRRGMEHSSAVCVMVGTQTWERPWVRYEIARTVVDNRGLLAVHINGLKHIHRQQPDVLGPNPLDFMGIYRKSGGGFYLYELNYVVVNRLTGAREWRWQEFQQHRTPVRVPKYLVAPQDDAVVQLSTGTRVHDYVTDRGSDNLVSWIDDAAKRVGR